MIKIVLQKDLKKLAEWEITTLQKLYKRIFAANGCGSLF